MAEHQGSGRQEHCSEPSCETTISAHAWGRIKSDWFFQKNGEQFCPEHTPQWVAQWRANKAHRAHTKET